MLSESNSWKSLPIRFIACSAGESAAISETLWALPTSSSCGTKTLVVAAMSSHTRTMGTENHRMPRAMRCTTGLCWA